MIGSWCFIFGTLAVKKGSCLWPKCTTKMLMLFFWLWIVLAKSLLIGLKGSFRNWSRRQKMLWLLFWLIKLTSFWVIRKDNMIWTEFWEIVFFIISWLVGRNPRHFQCFGVVLKRMTILMRFSSISRINSYLIRSRLTREKSIKYKVWVLINKFPKKQSKQTIVVN